MSNEADSRIIIDRLLREADWDIEDKAQVSTEEAVADGRADYVLKDSRSRPLAVIEAKRFSIAQRKRLPSKVFLAYEMPLPSTKTQQRLREMKIRVDELRKRHAHQRAELEALMPAVLDRAFRGEL